MAAIGKLRRRPALASAAWPTADLERAHAARRNARYGLGWPNPVDLDHQNVCLTSDRNLALKIFELRSQSLAPERHRRRASARGK
jgi:hypothetical protein